MFPISLKICLYHLFHIPNFGIIKSIFDYFQQKNIFVKSCQNTTLPLLQKF